MLFQRVESAQFNRVLHWIRSLGSVPHVQVPIRPFIWSLQGMRQTEAFQALDSFRISTWWELREDWKPNFVQDNNPKLCLEEIEPRMEDRAVFPMCSSPTYADSPVRQVLQALE